MNDYSELETRLKALRPAPLRENFVARVEQAMTQTAPPADPSAKIIRPVQFRRHWLVGLGLAAAAALFLLVRANFQAPQEDKPVAANSPQPTLGPVRSNDRAIQNTFIPAGSTQVVYHKRDEGLLFAQNSEEPVRRFRSMTHETLQWRNPVTGASLQISYPSEQVELVPISAQ